MKIYNRLMKRALCIGVITITYGCGSDSSDTTGPEELTCQAPQVFNTDKSACITPVESNSAPTITSDLSFSFEDNSAIGTTVYTATGSDLDGDNITWALIDNKNIFEIDAVSGVVTVLDTNQLLGTDLANYEITVIAKDDAAESKESSIQITVTVIQTSNELEPTIVPSSSEAVFYYKRDDANYTGWTLHAWNNETCDGYADYASDAGTDWTAGLTHSGIDKNFGAYYSVDTKGEATCLNFILHNGDVKDPSDGDQKLNLTDGRWAFIVAGGGIYTDPSDITTGTPLVITGASAHWIDTNTILWNGDSSELKLLSDKSGQLDEKLNLSSSLDLIPTTLTEQQKLRVPHLVKDWKAYTFEATVSEQKALLKEQLVVTALEDDMPISATYVQTAKAIDAIYTFGADDADEVSDLGVTYFNGTIKVKVWSPTAQDLNLKVYSANKSLIATHDMTYDDNTGIWFYEATDSADYDRAFYRFEIVTYHPITTSVITTESTDPYSVNTSTNGRYSQFVNLTDEDLKPTNWDSHSIPTIKNLEDAVILETHIRDFSIFDQTTSADNRGKYLAFSEIGTDANEYLSTLASSGVTHFHMLPANDIASVEEDKSQRIDLTNTVGELCVKNGSAPVCGTQSNDTLLVDVLDSYDVTTNDARDLVKSFSGIDGFNWGYDPHHFNVVEGSYSSDPEGVARIKEFRTMVMALHEKGLRVVLDVVYNHTSSSGLYDNSVFDKLVPGYYHRYSETTGLIERSTCCENTATEHRMMGKFVVDSLVHWAEHYGLDGFRFDIMGHMPLDVILEGRNAVAQIDADTYFYGEGWDWGEVTGNRLFKQATQVNIADTEIGSFNDRPRDSIRSASLSQSSPSLSNIDHIRLGMAGTLQNFELVDQHGVKRLGKHFAQSSYALDPADIINYISKHDNESLWDNLQYLTSLSADVDSNTRVRIHSLSAAIPLLSQGIPFFQLAVDKLRSKSLDRNTYDAGDWFNRVDYTNMTNNWNVGLPIERGDDFDANILANPNTAVSQGQIEKSSSVFNEFLKIRQSTMLFRLTDEAQVIKRVGFHNTGPEQTRGVIVMSIDDGLGVTDLDENNDAIVVVVNGSQNAVQQNVASASDFQLHPVQMSSADSAVQEAKFTQDGDVGTFHVPAYTVAVFVKPQGSAQGQGLSTDPDFVVSPYGEDELFLTQVETKEVAFVYDGRGTYEASITLDSGAINFDIETLADDSVDLSLSDVEIDADSIALAHGDNNDFVIDISSAGSYSVTLDITGSKPSLAVKLVNSLVTCEIPLSVGNPPFDIKNGKLFVKGEQSGWVAKDEFELVYIGNNQYQNVANYSGSFPFKLASNDENWETQLWVQNNAGEIETADLKVGVNYDVAFKDASTTNNQITLNEGKYRFSLSLNEDNPTVGLNVGTLLIEQCSN